MPGKLAKIDPEEKARRARQKAFLTLCTDLRERERKHHEDMQDGLARLEELASTGQTSTEAVYSDYVRAWERIVGDTYDANITVGKGVIRRLLKRKSAKVVRDRMIVFFHDDFAKRQGYKITAFGGMFDTLSAKASQAGGAAELLNEDGWFDS